MTKEKVRKRWIELVSHLMKSTIGYVIVNRNERKAGKIAE